jgi:hypothetical protein
MRRCAATESRCSKRLACTPDPVAARKIRLR